MNFVLWILNFGNVEKSGSFNIFRELESYEKPFRNLLFRPEIWNKFGILITDFNDERESFSKFWRRRCELLPYLNLLFYYYWCFGTINLSSINHSVAIAVI